MRRVTGVPVLFRSPREIDDLASNVRRRLAPNVEPDEKIDMARVLESIDGTRVRLPKGRQATVKLSVEDLPRHILAETHVVEDTVYLTIGANPYQLLCNDEGWARFTAAHEIGHVIMHLSALQSLERVGHHDAALARATSDHNLVVDSEFQANRFAAAFLAPNEGMQMIAERTRVLAVKDVMRTFGLGRKCATARIEIFGRDGRVVRSNPWGGR